MPKCDFNKISTSFYFIQKHFVEMSSVIGIYFLCKIAVIPLLHV